MTAKEPPIDQVAIRDLKPGDTIFQFFQVRSMELRKTKSGKDYLDLTIGDSASTVSAKMWSEALIEWGHEFTSGDFVKVAGRVDSYRDQRQVVIQKIRRVSEDEIPDPDTLVQSPKHDIQTILDQLKEIAQSLEPPELANLVETILVSNTKELELAPAARMVHHAYGGGLAEHTLSVVRKVEVITRLEPKVNRSIALAGALLHDIGKLQELKGAGQGRTVEGRLVGHLALGVEIVQVTAQEMGLGKPMWLRELEHIILSHHGEYEFGSPVRPLTREAILVHFIDNLDARLQMMEEALQEVDSQGFTPYNRYLQGRVFAGSKILSQEDDDVGN